MHKPLSKTKIKRLNESLAVDANSKEIILFLLDVDDPVNVGGLFRTADALDINKILLTEKTPNPPHPQISMTSRGMERRIEWNKINDPKNEIRRLKQKGFQIIAAELTEDSVAYNTCKYNEKVCIILGSESHGVYKNILKLCNVHVAIPMLGKGLSLNVHVAGEILASYVRFEA